MIKLDQKRKSVSESDQNKLQTTTTPSKKRKSNHADEEISKITKRKVYINQLFEKGYLKSGDTVVFKCEEREVKCKVNSSGELEVENPETKEKKASNNIRIIIQHIAKWYKSVHVPKQKFWNSFYLLRGSKQTSLKIIREKYL